MLTSYVVILPWFLHPQLRSQQGLLTQAQTLIFRVVRNLAPLTFPAPLPSPRFIHLNAKPWSLAVLSPEEPWVFLAPRFCSCRSYLALTSPTVYVSHVTSLFPSQFFRVNNPNSFHFVTELPRKRIFRWLSKNKSTGLYPTEDTEKKIKRHTLRRGVQRSVTLTLHAAEWHVRR